MSFAVLLQADALEDAADESWYRARHRRRRRRAPAVPAARAAKRRAAQPIAARESVRRLIRRSLSAAFAHPIPDASDSNGLPLQMRDFAPGSGRFCGAFPEQ